MSEEINRPGFYAVIPATVRYDKRLTDFAKLIYGEISALASEKGFCWARNKYFADIHGVDERTVQRAISLLKQCVHIRIEYLYKEGTNYVESRHLWLVVDPFATATSYGDKSVTIYRQNCHLDGDKSVTYTNNNLDNNNSSSPSGQNAPDSRKRGKRIDPDFKVDAEIKKWRDWKYPWLTDEKLDEICEAFVDSKASTPGQKGLSLDWNMTFKGWVRNEIAWKKLAPGAQNGNGNGNGAPVNGAAKIGDCKLCQKHLDFPNDVSPCQYHQKVLWEQWKKNKEKVNA